MADDPNVTTSGVPNDDRSPHSAPEFKPCSHVIEMNNRNLIVCIDDTASRFREKNTNVMELYNLILKEVGHNQRTWYNSGIGTDARPSLRQLLSHKINLAIAWEFERTILAAYQWLSENYEHGDCIFLFGFSRAAYQVRVLSAMIDKVGLIYKGNETQIPFAYELYSDPKSDDAMSGVGSLKKMSKAQRFKEVFSYKDVRVHFVGAWDSVSSIGITRGKHILPWTADGMKHVCFFRHALALDERRVKFLPEYAYGGTANPPPKPEDKKVSPVNPQSPHNGNNPSTASMDGPIANNPSDDRPIDNEAIDAPSPSRINSMESRPHTIEVWFAGTHSDIGGGNVENAGLDRSRPPLRWMVFEAGALGLRTAPFGRELSPNEQIEIKESLTWKRWFLELFPFLRLTCKRREQRKRITHKPHLGSSRKIHPGQKIHSSLLLSDNRHYFWQARSDGLGDWLELDLYEYTQTLVWMLINETPGTLQTLHQTAMSVHGRQAVYEGVVRALGNLEPQDKHRLLHSAVDILGKSAQGGTPLKLHRSIEIHPLVRDLLESDIKNYQQVVRQFLVEFTDFCMFVVRGHADHVWSIACSPNGRHIASGSSDKTVRIWDVETGKQVREPFKGHTGSVPSVAFSPDGKRIVSGSHDRTIRIWDPETGKSVGEPFRGHTGWVQSVTFSPDGRRVASGSHDKTVWIWDTEAGKPVGEPFRGHTNRVWSVAFSPDGRRVVSGSADETVRIWDAGKGKPVGEPLQGHTDSVMSAAFSPDGSRIVSGSIDGSVRIWCAKTGEPVAEPFRGHTDSVPSVAFSPDGRHIVSCSLDKTIRIWDAMTMTRL